MEVDAFQREARGYASVAWSVIRQLGDAMLSRGWLLDRQTPPDSLHATVSNSNTGVTDQYLKDLAEAVDQVNLTIADAEGEPRMVQYYMGLLVKFGLAEGDRSAQQIVRSLLATGTDLARQRLGRAGP